ncbi:MAG: stage III sporulation protein AG [Lachnospiraceae bacterium]|nr:stage III sporulation protein AG [Lachnospiraceae bacterium]
MIWRRLMWKFKQWKGKDKWLFLLTIGVILCILAFPAERLTKKEMKEKSDPSGGSFFTGGSLDKEYQKNGRSGAAEGGKENERGNGDAQASDSDISENAIAVMARVSDSYEAELEQRVREILKNVEGVGKVDVMIVLKSSGEKVVQVDGKNSRSLTEEQDSSGGTRRIENLEQEQNTVMASGNGENAPVIAKELRPELSGIIISAEGGGNPAVQSEISAAMEALFGLPAHKIKVLKRVE